MDMIQNLWNSIGALHKASSIFQWVSFILIFLGLLSGIAKYFVDQQEKHLTKLSQDAKETTQVKREEEFGQTIKSLESELSERKKDITELEKKTVPVNPYRQLIRTATATVEVTIKSDQQINTQFLDRGGYMAFGKGTTALLLMSSTTCFARQTGNGQVVYRGVFQLDATSEATQRPILFLKEADYVQIGFKPMPESMEVLGGKAICTLNNTVRVELPIPSQKMQKDIIMILNIQPTLSDFKE